MTKFAGLRINTIAAIFGGGAVVSMGVIAAAVGGAQAGPPVVASGGSMTIGETTTVTYTGTVAPVVAKPAVKAPPYGGG
ncbi:MULTISPECIES: hypothetical protein [Mycolicibacterium]|uniref:Uncharacterized protein n=1 Tax=Mycolicibacterium wolinskyi TaxID=59750 RepID=A0A1X2F9I3_9MYCO|nr:MULTISPECIES: hypothetical protein [Mycolicibacterium]MCV7287473.1 hypothetical protein [Mycolicibacterium wolinskyi]MCV7294371.1 hypothetical protein [Mycolicibacterium goodii]ORX14998.1 hypothetical protein AWC31_28120 [Mycolicibacterium wolinskyi]